MKKQTLHFESIGGASGDMILGALIGLGVSSEEFTGITGTLLPQTFSACANRV